MSDVLWAVLGGLFALLLSLLGIEKVKTKKERKAKEKAEEERDKLKVQTKVQETADQIKDDLAKKKAENRKAEEEVIHDLEEIPEEKEVPLSEEVKKMAADQSARARARAEQLQND